MLPATGIAATVRIMHLGKPISSLNVTRDPCIPQSTAAVWGLEQGEEHVEGRGQVLIVAGQPFVAKIALDSIIP
jgi:hypothetical protein